MRILLLGAGAVGGYYGARLLQAGAEVVFLVHDKRARQLASGGLAIAGAGDAWRVPARAITRIPQDERYDLVLLSCKAYDFPAAIETVSPAVGPDTLVLPLLNGVAHIEALEARFGRGRIIAGSCHLSAALEPDGTIRRYAPLHRIVFGVREGNLALARERLAALHENFRQSAVPVVLSPDVMQELWDKYVLLCTLASMTCLMRAAVGDIVSTDRGRQFALEVLETCANVAGHEGHRLPAAVLRGAVDWATEPGSSFTASMLRDIERGGRTEGEHILGDMLRRAQAAGIEARTLAVAHCHLQAYETRRSRETRENRPG